MTLTVEYLIIIKQADDFCKNEDSFINFIAVDTTLKPAKKMNIKTITDLSSQLEVQYEIVCEEILSKGERIFNLKMLSREENKISEFNTLTRKIKKIALKINPEKTQIHTIQDDIGSHYAIKAYPIIHDIENTLRKLISKFMIINVGMDWFKEAVHDDISKDLEKKKKTEIFNDYLQNLDFIDLSNVLFKPFRSITTNDFDKIISAASKIEDIDFLTLKKYVPKSNWERYFSQIVQIEGNVLQEKWTKLYDIRNDVAHNRYLTIGRFEELNNIIASIKPNLDKALENLDKVKLSPLDINLIAQLLNKNSYSNMPRLMAAAKEFNIGVNSLIDFLISKEIDESENLKPTSKITELMYQELHKEFGKKHK
jgi:hypothetical protein